MSRQGWVELLAAAVADGTAVANTTTRTILMPNLTIPANYMQDGRALRARLYGKHSTTGTPTMIFGAYWGGALGTLLAQTAAITTISGAANVPWEMDVMIQTRTNGSAGALLVDGTVTVFSSAAPTVASATGNAATTPLTAGGASAPAAVSSLDLTADTQLSFTLTWSSASSSNTATAMHYELESKN